MSYSITPTLHGHKDKNGCRKILIQLIYERKKYYGPTEYKVRDDQWAGGVINHPNRSKINAAVLKRIQDIESRVIDIIESGATPQKLLAAVRETQAPVKSIFLSDYILGLADRLKGKLSIGSLKHYRSLAGKVNPEVMLSQINTKWLDAFEAGLRKPYKIKDRTASMDSNTVNANMKRLKGILVKARREGLIKEEAYKDYAVPLYKQKLFDFLTEEEVNKLFALVRTVENPAHKLTGYYFLLSCKAGYRISDLRTFDYEKRVVNGSIILRAGKNSKIVNIPVYESLGKILEYIKDKPFNISERNGSDYLKTLCTLAGIKKKVSFHTGRRTWAMTLLANGFTIDEVADTLGDSRDVAKVYAQMNNSILAKKIMSTLK